MTTAAHGTSPDRSARDAVRTFDVVRLDATSVLAAKGTQPISVIIPARDEASTIGSVLDALAVHGPTGTGLVDEVLVIDDNSTDDTAAVALGRGAAVLSLSTGGGKGAAMAAGVEAALGDLLVFLDADVVNTSPDYVLRLVAPLLLDESIALVKGYYERPFGADPTGGGRVTELTARPALSLLFPELATVRQPLAGETATRREVLEKVGLEPGYKVEMGLLIDVGMAFGASAISQVDLGVRRHRNRPLSELGPMAQEVLAAALERSGAGRRREVGADHDDDVVPGGTGHGH